MITAVVKSEFREERLNRAVPGLAEMVARASGCAQPDVLRITVSWPATGHKGKAIGECYAPVVSADNGVAITISPKLDDAVEVLAVLLHELIHSAVGLECGHRGAFKTTARKVGLVGKMKATTPGPALEATLKDMAQALGPYPHSRMDMGAGRKKQGTRMLKLVCPDCEYTCRTTAQWIEVGLPTCPCGTEMTQAV